MSRGGLASAFEDGPALISYIAAGDPNVDATKEYVKALVRGGSDVIELGLPFSEPIAEGPTIQAAVRRALESGMTPQRYLDLVAELDDEVDVPLVCMTYYNLIYQYGESEARSVRESQRDTRSPSEVLRTSEDASENANGEQSEPRAKKGPGNFVAAAAAAGIDGFVIPDLPVDESGPMYEACQDHGADLVFIVAPTTTEHRLDRMLGRSSGFVYVQGRMGTTGAQDDVSNDAQVSLERLQDSDVPKAVGFGISKGAHAHEIIASGADGIIVGSAYVDLIAEGTSAGSQNSKSSDEIAEGVENDDVSQEDVASNLESLARELKAGATEGLPEPESK